MATSGERIHCIPGWSERDAPLDQAGRRWFHPNPTIGQVFFG